MRLPLPDLTSLAAPLSSTLPPEAFWLPWVLLIILGAAAVFDALKGRIPDGFILLGFFVLVLAQGLYVDWIFAGSRLALGFAAALFVWSLNHLWFLMFRRDALGLGDAKWTALAVASFHVIPSLFAWFAGAWLGILWLGLSRLFGHKIWQVHCAPFLFIGLLIGLHYTYAATG